MTSSYLSVIDPSLLTGVRDHLASMFAARVAAVLPTVSEFVDFESELIVEAKARRSLATASNLLIAHSAKIEASLIADFTARFNAIRDPVKARSRRPRVLLDTLSLVQDDQMQEEMAIIACAQRLKEQSDYELFTLTRRICVLTGQDRIADDSNPIYPKVFARALLHALGSVEVVAPVKLAIFKAFGPLLLEIMPETYAAGSAWLSERGVELDAYVYLPVVAPARAPGVSKRPPVATTSVASAEQLGKLLDILHQVMPASTEPFAPVAASIKTPNFGLVAGPRQSLALAAELLAAMLDILGADVRVPIALRPVIARLRDPLTRLVTLDRSFFTWTAHPARKLLERLAEFGMAMHIETGDADSLNSVARLVEAMVRREGSDQYAFKLALERLDALFHHHEECALQHDPDILDLQASESRECALLSTNRVISERLNGRRVPSDIVAFVLVTWRAVMVCDYLHGGTDGVPWKLGVATLDELLKSIAPVSRKEQRAGRADSLSSLVELIRDGIAHANMNPLLADDFLQKLHAMHQLTVRGAGNTALALLVPLSFPLPADVGRSTQHAPTQALAELGLKVGMWLEFKDDACPTRWRLCWATPFRGYCVLKQYESRRTRVLPIDELRTQLVSRKATIVDGLGLVTSALSRAFKQVNESIRQRSLAIADDSASLHPPQSPLPLDAQERLAS